MINLPIKKIWFDMIASGDKKEEYRNITPRHTALFNNAINENNEFICMLRNGYSKNSPVLVVKVRLSIGCGLPEWGAEPNKQYYILSVLEIIDIHK